MTTKERWALALDHREADRVPVADAVWPTTEARWRKEGLPEGVSVGDYFGWEVAWTGPNTTLGFARETVEETDDYVVTRGPEGVLARNWKGKASTPEFLDWTIKTQADWDQHKGRLWENLGKTDWEAARGVQRDAEAKDRWFVYGSFLGFEKVNGWLGTERLLVAMVEEPEWVEEMFRTCGELAIAGLEEMRGHGIRFEGAWFSDDMAYRNATLFSPAMYRRYEFPHHQRVFDACRGHGMPAILHTDGDVRAFIPMLIEAGLTCLQPLEVKAGMDVIELKRQYGEALCFMGGIDVRKMAHPDPAVIEHEIASKLSFAKRGGGYLYHSDHSVPDDVSWERYQLVMELVREYGAY